MKKIIKNTIATAVFLLSSTGFAEFGEIHSLSEMKLVAQNSLEFWCDAESFAEVLEVNHSQIEDSIFGNGEIVFASGVVNYRSVEKRDEFGVYKVYFLQDTICAQ